MTSSSGISKMASKTIENNSVLSLQKVSVSRSVCHWYFIYNVYNISWYIIWPLKFIWPCVFWDDGRFVDRVWYPIFSACRSRDLNRCIWVAPGWCLQNKHTCSFKILAENSELLQSVLCFLYRTVNELLFHQMSVYFKDMLLLFKLPSLL